MSTQIPSNSGYGDAKIAVSDSEADDSDDSRRGGVQSHWDHPSNLATNTRLKGDAFEWLVEWCEQNADRIESRRVLERIQNGHEVRRLVQDLNDNDEEMDKILMNMTRMKVKRRSIKRKLLVLTDEEGLISENGLATKKKVYLFCTIMASPKYDFHRSGMPFVKTERELVQIYHQVMSAMRVLHYDYVELPKLADKNFKHRNPSPAKWMVLKPPLGRFDLRGDQLENAEDPLVQNYVSSEQDARMACTALQNLLWNWQKS
ncbi:Hypothetical predicted protein [Lecanosticta acicola]|uniref:Uncharacterized protein n=1 Tax=Lecanosticta acicola TaxID=111012 RepID=A0AAI8Z7D1_9PEZI|nr:Hypothetical predicted protein [Lecanosticta acicola]